MSYLDGVFASFDGDAQASRVVDDLKSCLDERRRSDATPLSDSEMELLHQSVRIASRDSIHDKAFVCLGCWRLLYLYTDWIGEPEDQDHLAVLMADSAISLGHEQAHGCMLFFEWILHNSVPQASSNRPVFVILHTLLLDTILYASARRSLETMNELTVSEPAERVLEQIVLSNDGSALLQQIARRRVAEGRSTASVLETLIRLISAAT